ncbi:MAG: S8 family serine peptidase, partial [Blastocatellia bacterium]
LNLLKQLQLAPARQQTRIAHFVNLIVALPPLAIEQIANREDVISITRYSVPRRLDERQNQIVAGNLSGTQPATGDYLAYLAAKGFTQAQFTASNFVVNVSDSGIDNATTLPNHFGLYTGGNTANASRVVYNRLVGTPSGPGSTLVGCDGHGTINSHIIAGFIPTGAPFNVFPHTDAAGFRHGLGVAPFVKVGSSVIFDNSTNFFGDYTFPDFVELESRAYNDRARISSNSWGGNTNGEYNIDAQIYDFLTRDAQPAGAVFSAAGNQELVTVFAAGNSGPLATTVAPPASAKNTLSVGASESVNQFGGPDKCTTADSEADSANDLSIFTSRGPTFDGRRKPEIVAPGTHVTGGVIQIPNPPANGQADACFNGVAVCGGPPISPNFFPVGQQFYTASSGT